MTSFSKIKQLAQNVSFHITAAVFRIISKNTAENIKICSNTSQKTGAGCTNFRG